MSKPLQRRPAAIEDMILQLVYRREKAGSSSADALVDELQASLQSISERPGAGSHRIGQLVGIPQLQWKRVGKTRLWFWYVEEATYIDVVRLISTDQLPRLAMLPEDIH